MTYDTLKFANDITNAVKQGLCAARPALASALTKMSPDAGPHAEKNRARQL